MKKLLLAVLILVSPALSHVARADSEDQRTQVIAVLNQILSNPDLNKCRNKGGFYRAFANNCTDWLNTEHSLVAQAAEYASYGQNQATTKVEILKYKALVAWVKKIQTQDENLRQNERYNDHQVRALQVEQNIIAVRDQLVKHAPKK